MKKLFLIFAISLFLGSCQITERVHLHEDGSVKYEIDVHSAQMASFMRSTLNVDSLRQIGQFPIDTIVSFSEADNLGLTQSEQNPHKDSEAYQRLQQLSSEAQLHYILNQEQLDFTVIIEKESVSAFNTYVKALQEAEEAYQALNPSKKSDKQEDPTIFKNVQFSYDGNTFTRYSEPAQQDKETSKAKSNPQDFSKMMVIKMEYHFPKPVKKCSLKEATFSMDRKTMYVETTQKEINENPEKYNFVVHF